MKMMFRAIAFLWGSLTDEGTDARIVSFTNTLRRLIYLYQCQDEKYLRFVFHLTANAAPEFILVLIHLLFILPLPCLLPLVRPQNSIRND